VFYKALPAQLPPMFGIAGLNAERCFCCCSWFLPGLQKKKKKKKEKQN